MILVLGAAFFISYFLWSKRETTKTSSEIANDLGTLPSALPEAQLGVSSAASPVGHHDPKDLQKVKVLEQILSSKNDNDPRLDREFIGLSAGAKSLFRDQYRSLPAEKRNERGTVVFLLGRNLTSESDFDFFCEVLREPPCFSLADCHRSSASREDFDRESGEEITLAYPQIVALKVLEKAESKWRQHVVKTLDCAKDSKVGVVARRATVLSQEMSP